MSNTSSQLEQWAEDIDKLPYKERDFDRIPLEQRLHPNYTLCGLLYFYNLLPDGCKRQFDLHSEHDILYVGHYEYCRPITYEDMIYLDRCGIHYSNDNEGFCQYN